MGPVVSGEDKRSAFYQELVVGRGDVWRELQPLFSNIYRVGLIGEEWKGVSQWGIVASFVSSSSFGVNAGWQALSFSHQGLPPSPPSFSTF